MSVEIFNTTDARWNHYFKLLPHHLQDPFFTSEYYTLQSRDGLCFIYEEDDNFLFYPFVKRSINKLGFNLEQEYYDIQGAYGYNGALVKNDADKLFLQRAREAFLAYVTKENIIAEFMRFNPLYKNHNYFFDMQVLHINKNIVVDLQQEDIWRNAYEHSTRKNVKKALRSGLTFKIFEAQEMSDEDIQTFSDVYTTTMQRNDADEEYFFGIDYFLNLRDTLQKNALFIFIYKEKKVISVELVLLSEHVAYSFLGGTLKEYFEFRPNDYLKHTLIETLQKRGLDSFMLGGGVAMDDGIFKYKKNFSKNGVYDFYIGKAIHNQELYDTVIKQWMQKVDVATQEKYGNYLLKYHYGVSK